VVADQQSVVLNESPKARGCSVVADRHTLALVVRVLAACRANGDGIIELQRAAAAGTAVCVPIGVSAAGALSLRRTSDGRAGATRVDRGGPAVIALTMAESEIAPAYLSAG